MRTRWRFLARSVAPLLALAGAWLARADAQSPRSQPTPQAPLSASSAKSIYSVDAVDALFHDFVDGQGGVDYKRLKAQRADLDAFVASLAGLDPATIASWTAPERIAFWVNAYNTITLQRIVDHYPIHRGSLVASLRFPENSIRQIEGVWDNLSTSIAGRDMTLDHIEHEILRKDFREPRIHAALVCAAKGCPPLRAEAFIAARLDKQLDDQSRRFLASPKRFKVDRQKKIVRLSPLLKWYAEDFVAAYNTDGSLQGHSAALCATLDYASRYVAPKDAQFLRTQSYTVEYSDYDWSLNERE